MKVIVMKPFKFCGNAVKKGDTIDIMKETAKIYKSLKLIDYITDNDKKNEKVKEKK